MWTLRERDVKCGQSICGALVSRYMGPSVFGMARLLVGNIVEPSVAWMDKFTSFQQNL